MMAKDKPMVVNSRRYLLEDVGFNRKSLSGG